MDKVKIYFDEQGNSLTVWFGNPSDEVISEETGNEFILMKNKSGDVIGFEKLNYTHDPSLERSVVFETAVINSKH